MRLTCLIALITASVFAACGGASGKGQCSTPGAMECVTDSVARVCAMDNTWTQQECSSDQTCMGSGGCALRTDLSCNPADNGCVDSTHAVVCNPDGKGFQSVTCPANTTCSGFGTCLGTCVVGSSRCSSTNTVQTCTDGFTYTDTDCMPGMTTCVTTSSPSAAVQTAACMPSSCVSGSVVCGDKAADPTSTDPNYSSTCTNSTTGLKWQSEQCAVAGSCSPGSGCQQTCTPGQQRCNGFNIQTCDSTSHWGMLAPCQPTSTGVEQVCQIPAGSLAPVCGDRLCSTGAAGACEADGFHACVNGKVSTAATPCAIGVCIGSQTTSYDGLIPGSCQAQCNPGDSRCASTEAYEACGSNGRWSTTTTQCPANGTDHCVQYTDTTGGGQKTLCGVCAPGSHRCSDSTGTTTGPEIATCDATGHYGSPQQCAMGQCQSNQYTQSVDAACVMQCIPGSTLCIGAAPTTPPNPSHPGTANWGTCDAAGNLPTTTTACTTGTSCRKHSDGQAVGNGSAACVQCVGTDNENGFVDSACITTSSPNSIETCSAGNMWNTPTTCTNTAPYAGTCVAEAAQVCGGQPYYEGSFCSNAYLVSQGYSQGCQIFGSNNTGPPVPWGTTSDCCTTYFCLTYSSNFIGPAVCQ